MPRTQPELASGYYLAHFQELLRFVQTHYQGVLTAESQAFITDFAALPTASQQLLVRMLNRKGVVFADNELEYAEIAELQQCLITLKQQGFVGALQGTHLAGFWLRVTKETLWQLLQLAQTALGQVLPVRKSHTKPQLLREALALPVDWLALIAQLPQHYVVLQRQEALQYLYFLYFGRIETNLAVFTLRDLGIRQTGQLKQGFRPRFTEQAQALLAFQLAQAKTQIQELTKAFKRDADIQALGETLTLWLKRVQEWPVSTDLQLAEKRSDRCYQLGRLAEQQGLADLAVAFYQHSNGFPASERLVRLWWAQGETAACHRYLQQLVDDPACDEEWLFAEDFMTRHFASTEPKPRRSRLTELLAQAPSTGIDELYLGKAERGVIAHYQAQGFAAFHTENNLWLALFALWFWHELFEHPESALHNPFERRPRNLSAGVFYQQFQTQIEAKLQQLTLPSAPEQLLATLTAHYGKANQLFYWHEDLAAQLLPLLKLAPASGLCSILRAMAQDFYRNHTGYPDLLLLKDQQLSFVEVKAPGDKIQRHQLARLLSLQQAGFNARIEKLHWIVDPNRLYVVLDVETTGGKASLDRVIEVGAVKVQAGKVIDTFSTLLNPKRHIPSFISRLTGIDNTMVAAAPTFAEIATDLQAFLTDAVFVAHNAKFDYGFISAEFARVGLPFDMPQLCTVVNMRRYYPGQASYSLGNLCRDFAIPLKNHHRALDDAMATVSLLHLINAKRVTGAA